MMQFNSTYFFDVYWLVVSNQACALAEFHQNSFRNYSQTIPIPKRQFSFLLPKTIQVPELDFGYLVEFRAVREETPLSASFKLFRRLIYVIR
jgi:hypothetical protein